MEKMTKVEKFAVLRSLVEASEDANKDMLVEFIDHEVELLEKKNSADRKPTPQQVANQTLQAAIYEGMERGKLYTITDLIKTIPACADMTNQRVSAVVRQMIGTQIERVEEKRKAYFKRID